MTTEGNTAMNISRMRGLRGSRLRTRVSLMTLGLGIAFGAVPLAITPLVVSADAPSGINFDIQGCQTSEASVSSSAPHVCPDADYAQGNQGKKWNELDIVPMRVWVTAGSKAPASETYQFATVGDYTGKGGVPGFDYMSAATLNTALSDATCTAPAVGASATVSPGLNNALTSIYRELTVTQLAGTTCVFDYWVQPAVGSSAYPGSALHSDLGTVVTSGSTVTGLDSIPGSHTVQLDVNAVTLPSLSAAVNASQGQGYQWTLSKGAVPDPATIGNTCDPEQRSEGVDVTLTWHRVTTSADSVTVLAQLFADNPTGRAMTAHADAQLLDAAANDAGASYSVSGVNVPAKSVHYQIGSFTRTFPSGSSSSYSVSVSNGGFTDPVTSLPVGGTLTASASSPVTTVNSGANATAVVTDVTSISGSGLRYSVDSVSLPGGSFGAYVLGTATTGSATWTSPTLSGDGSAILHETVSATGPTSASGSLDDVANVTGSSGLATGTHLEIPVSTGALFDLTVAGSIPAVLQGSETASFDVTVTDSHGTSTPLALDFGAGQTSASEQLTGLAAGTYTVHEAPAAGWTTPADQTVTLATPDCAKTVSVANSVVPATASVRKITVPAGFEAGWSFVLTGPGAPANGEKVTTTGTGAVVFDTVLQEGDYTITEVSERENWLQGGTSGCSFTVDYPADAAHAFACTITNVQAAVQGVTTGNNPPAGTGSNGNTPAAGEAPISTPFTGADLPFTQAGVLVLLGGGLVAWGWRRRTSTR